jgi:serine/threonine protein kinase
MSTPAACPPAERLRQLLDDHLDPEVLAELTAHLDACPGCQGRLQTLAGGDSAGNITVPMGLVPPVPEPVLQRVLAALKTEPSPAPWPTRREDWVLALLGPPTALGSLGRLDAYDVEGVLGCGGMGVVLKAFDPSLRRHVAIKVLAPDLASDPGARHRFAREARSAAAVRHANVVTIHAVAEVRGLPYLVMEHVTGGSLQEYLDRHGPPDLLTIVRVAAQCAAGLAAAHAAGIVHRDLKPANILLAVSGQRSAVSKNHGGTPDKLTANSCLLTAIVKIADFGLARAADEATLTQSGVVAGTPMYMAPEQALGEAVDARSDLFSLGSVFYVLCTGRPPFSSGAPVAVLRQVCDVTPLPAEQLNSAVPTWLSGLIEALHAKRPAERFLSAAELAELLRQHLAHLEDPELVPRPPDVARQLRKRRASRRRWVLAALVLWSLVVLGLAWGWWRDRSGPGGPMKTLRGHEGMVWSLAFSPSGRFLASASDDTTVRVWITASGTEVAVLREHKREVYAVEFDREGQLLASGGAGGELYLWRNDNFHKAAGYQRGGGIRALAFARGGRTLAVGGQEQVIELLNPSTGAVRARLTGHRDSVTALAYAPHGQTLVSADAAGHLRAWSAAGTLLAAWQGHAGRVRSLAFSRDGETLASAGSDRTVCLWGARGWGQRAALAGHTNSVEAVGFTPNGRLLASGTRDRTITLWDPATAKEQATLKGRSAVYALAISPDGATLATGGGDKNVYLWDLPP